MQADLQTISTALEAYKTDFDQYPQIITPQYGAETLFLTLMGPNGNGFRTRTGGKVWGPYLPTDFKNNNTQLLDRYKHPICYFPARKGAGINITGANGQPRTPYVLAGAGMSMFNASDNAGPTDGYPAAAFQRLMGVSSGSGVLLATETPAYLGDYVLVSFGPDETPGPPNPNAPISTSNKCDDVTNFPRLEY